MIRIKLLLCVVLAFCMHAATAQRTYLDNGIIKVGCDLGYGGALNYLSVSGSSTNLINNFDKGRQVQQSYYAGQAIDRIAEGQHPAWSPWPWNPIQVGDAYGASSPVLAWSNDGTTIYTKTTPLLWDMNNEPGQAIIEQWTRLEGTSVHVTNKLTCQRTDNRWGLGLIGQELPAVYTIANLNKQYTYVGKYPFEDGGLTQITQVGPPWTWWGPGQAINGNIERWSANVDNNYWGVGVYMKDAEYFSGGRAGGTSGGEFDGSTTYLSPIKNMMLDKTTTYAYDYWLIVGNLTDIRSFIYQNLPSNIGPRRWEFTTDADWEGWLPVNHINTIAVTGGNLTFNTTGGDPYWSVARPLSIKAAENKWLHVRMQNGTSAGYAECFWANEFGQPDATRNLAFPIVPNSGYTDYYVDLSASPGWTGTITEFRIDPQLGASGPMGIDVLEINNNPAPLWKTNFEASEGWVAQANWPTATWSQTLADGKTWTGNLGAGTETFWVRDLAGAGFEGSNGFIMDRSVGGFLQTPPSAGAGALSFMINKSATTADWVVRVDKRINGGTWGSGIHTLNAADVAVSPGYSRIVVPVNEPATNTVELRLWITSRTTGNFMLDEIQLSPYVAPVTPPAWTQLRYDDFEAGMGGYTDGGADMSRYTGGSTFAHQGVASADIQDNSGTASAFTLTTGLNVSAYNEIKVEFWFKANSMEAAEDFWLQYYNGSTWQTVRGYAAQIDFQNGQWYSKTVTIRKTDYAFPTAAKIRFQCDASDDNDDVYIDEIRISAR